MKPAFAVTCLWQRWLRLAGSRAKAPGPARRARSLVPQLRQGGIGFLLVSNKARRSQLGTRFLLHWRRGLIVARGVRLLCRAVIDKVYGQGHCWECTLAAPWQQEETSRDSKGAGAHPSGAQFYCGWVCLPALQMLPPFSANDGCQVSQLAPVQCNPTNHKQNYLQAGDGGQSQENEAQKRALAASLDD